MESQMTTTARILSYEDGELTLSPDDPISRELIQKQCGKVEIRLIDGREITPDQRRAIFATIHDISLWSGHDPQYLRDHLTWDYLAKSGANPFSLSDCTVTDAHDFLDYLIDFVLRWDIPMKESLLKRTDDIGRYMYHCIEHSKCAVCGQPGEVHHVDTVGANGGSRSRIIHIGLRAVCLCRIHHEEAHTNENRFFTQHHLEPIKLDKYLCDIHRMNTESRKKITL